MRASAGVQFTAAYAFIRGLTREVWASGKHAFPRHDRRGKTCGVWSLFQLNNRGSQRVRAGNAMMAVRRAMSAKRNGTIPRKITDRGTSPATPFMI